MAASLEIMSRRGRTCRTNRIRFPKNVSPSARGQLEAIDITWKRIPGIPAHGERKYGTLTLSAAYRYNYGRAMHDKSRFAILLLALLATLGASCTQPERSPLAHAHAGTQCHCCIRAGAHTYGDTQPQGKP